MRRSFCGNVCPARTGILEGPSHPLGRPLQVHGNCPGGRRRGHGGIWAYLCFGREVQPPVETLGGHGRPDRSIDILSCGGGPGLRGGRGPGGMVGRTTGHRVGGGRGLDRRGGGGGPRVQHPRPPRPAGARTQPQSTEGGLFRSWGPFWLEHRLTVPPAQWAPDRWCGVSGAHTPRGGRGGDLGCFSVPPGPRLWGRLGPQWGWAPFR